MSHIPTLQDNLAEAVRDANHYRTLYDELLRAIGHTKDPVEAEKTNKTLLLALKEALYGMERMASSIRWHGGPAAAEYCHYHIMQTKEVIAEAEKK